MPAGIQTARPLGTTQLPDGQVTVMTPAMACTNCARGWLWGAMISPSQWLLAIAASGRGASWQAS